MHLKSQSILDATAALAELDGLFGTCRVTDFCEDDCPARFGCTATNEEECRAYLSAYDWDTEGSEA